jgi:hypothetical protein
MKKIKPLSKPANVEPNSWEHYLMNALIVHEKDWEKIRATAKTTKARN